MLLAGITSISHSFCVHFIEAIILVATARPPLNMCSVCRLGLDVIKVHFVKIRPGINLDLAILLDINI